MLLALGLGTTALVGLGIAQTPDNQTSPSQVESASTGTTTRVMLVAQADGAKKAMTPKAETTDKATTKEDSPRLPNNYGKLELSGEQKDQVYAIQKKYEAQIESLEKQLKELKAKRDAELSGVLSASQKTKLKEIQATPKTKKAKPAAPAAAKETK
ncbi:MAG: hypothetical protein C0478_10035 [Planctomyces sp.]|nr:hypothetical protein [Planctomyces sp.]